MRCQVHILVICRYMIVHKFLGKGLGRKSFAEIKLRIVVAGNCTEIESEEIAKFIFKITRQLIYKYTQKF